MAKVIEWCSSNKEWVSIIIASLSALMSVLAFLFSIKASRIPYKKSLRLSVRGHYKNNKALDSFEIIAVNTGNREIYIEFLGLVEGKGKHPKELLEYWSSMDDTRGIKPGEKFKKGYSASFYDELIKKISNVNRVFICAKDSEGKRYFQKIKLEKEPKL